MSGLPAVVVRLDDGTGTFPYDISAYVDTSKGLSISRGRPDEFGQVSASTLSLTLDNLDGRFTYGTSTYGIKVNQKIRVTETVGTTTSHRFTGFVQDWPAAWPAGGDNYSQVPITATDLLPRLARRSLRSVVEQEVLLDSPFAYYTLAEPSEATRAIDTSGNARNPLLVIAGAAPTFGDGTGPDTDGLSAAQFASSIHPVTGARSGGGYLHADLPITEDVPTSFECWVVIPTAPNMSTQLFWSLFSTGPEQQPAKWDIIVAYDGSLNVNGAVINSNLCDGRLHHIAAVWSSGGVNAYLDGVFRAGATSTNPQAFSVDVARAFTGTMAHAVLYRNVALSAARVKAHYDAGISGFASERSDQRVARLLSYANVTTTALETGALSVPLQNPTGASALDAINDVTDAEAGVFFVRGDGVPVLQNRTHRGVQVVPDLTLTTHDIGPDAMFSVDMQNVSNYATTKSVTGAEQLVRNATSIAAHEVYATSYDLLVSTDQEALDRANWVVNQNAQPQPKLPNVTVDLVSQTASIQQSVLGLELGDRIQITGLPSQSPGGTTADLIIEGWTESLFKDGWAMTFNTSNFAAFRQFILDDPTLGVLDSTVPLGI